MIELNKNKLIPGIDTSWGDIRGDISKQSDLMSMMSSYATQSWVSSQGYLTEHQPLKTINNQSLVGTGNITIEASVPDYYATKQWVSDQGYLTSETLPSDLATESWVSSNFLPTSALSGYATESWVSSNFLSTTALSGYATQSWVESQSYITSVALSGYATESWVSEQGYLTSVPSTYATQSWVEAQSYLTSSSLKTVNDQSLVGEGNIEIGGLTPEQEEAIEPLEETSKGMLYTFELPARSSRFVTMDNIESPETQNYLYKVGDDIYYIPYTMVYKYNPDKLNFEKVCNLSQTSYYPMWKDATGRYYLGSACQVDLSTGTCTPVTLDAINYAYYYNRHNIVHGKKGIYCFDTSFQKFDESAQKFVSFPCTSYPTTHDLQYIGMRLAEYEGHIIFLDTEGVMYEFIEGDDSVEIVEVSEPYFPVMGNNDYITSMYLFKIGGDYYYLREYNQQKLVSGQWVLNNITYDGSNTTYFYGEGLNEGDYLMGFAQSPQSTLLQLTNPGSTSYKKTYWASLSTVCVELGDSVQYIGGSKHFNALYASLLCISEVQPTGPINVNSNSQPVSIKAKKLEISVNDYATLNGSTLATTEDCIVNRTIYPCGPRFNSVGYLSFPYQFMYYWTTATGRVFVNYNGSTYEFNGTTFSQVTLTANPTMNTYVVSTDTDTFYSDTYGTYIWDNGNNDWLLITNQNPAGGESDYFWVCGDTIRYGNTHKLVESGGTYSWVEDPISNWSSGRYYVINNTVYCLASGTLYTYDDSTNTYTFVAYYNEPGIGNYFVCDGEIYILNWGNVKKLDMSLVGVQTYIDVNTDVYYAGDPYCFYGMYSGYVYLINSSSYIGYCFDVDETVPEVPSSNGTYILQAVRSASGVTFSWVSA